MKVPIIPSSRVRNSLFGYLNRINKILPNLCDYSALRFWFFTIVNVVMNSIAHRSLFRPLIAPLGEDPRDRIRALERIYFLKAFGALFPDFSPEAFY